MRVQGAAGRLAVLLHEQAARASRGAPRAPKAPSKRRKGRSLHGRHSRAGPAPEKRQRTLAPASAGNAPPDPHVEDCGEDGIYIWGTDTEGESPELSEIEGSVPTHEASGEGESEKVRPPHDGKGRPRNPYLGAGPSFNPYEAGMRMRQGASRKRTSAPRELWSPPVHEPVDDAGNLE